MTTSIGRMQVDFVANVNGFIASVNRAQKSIENFAKRNQARIAEFVKTTEERLQKYQRGFQEAGEKMTKFVTLPLLALGVAAIKAADPTGAFAKEMKTLGVEALLVLEPLGKVLILLIRQAVPFIRVALGFVRALTEKFAELNPVVQAIVVGTLALVAAIGPLSIVVGGFISILLIFLPLVAGFFTTLLGIIPKIIPGIMALSTAIPVLVGLGALLITATVGVIALYGAVRHLYDNWDAARFIWAEFVYDIETGVAAIKYRFTQMVDTVVAQLARLVPKIPNGVLDVFAGMAGPGGTQAVAMIKGMKELGDGVAEQVASYSNYAEELDSIHRRFEKSKAQIQEDFKNNGPGRGFTEILKDDFEATSDAISELIGRMREWAKLSPEAAAEWERLAEAAKNAKKKTEDALKDTFGGKVRDEIKGFAKQAGSSFADLALEGENSFKQLAKAFERMLFEMFATQLLFQPLFDAIGNFAGPIANRAAGAPTGGGAGAVRGVSASSLQAFNATGGNGVTVNVIDQRSSAGDVQVSERSGSGGRTIDVVVRDSVKKLIRSGDLDRDMRLAYGSSRTGRV
jgi:hypothetical protein